MDWTSRPARIARLKEKNHFDQVVMPLAYTGVGIAALLLFWQGLEFLEGNPTNQAIWIPALFFLLLPIPLALTRWIRRHHHHRLQA